MQLKVKQNILFKAIEAFVMIAASFVQLACITRLYEPLQVGQYQLVIAWIFIISAFSCCGGIGMIAMRELSTKSEKEQRSIFSTALILQAIISAALIFVTLIIVNYFTYFSSVAFALSLASTIVVIFVNLQLSQALLFSKEMVGKVVIASIAAHLITTLLIIVSAYNRAPTHILVASWTFYFVFNGLILFVWSKAWSYLSFAVIDRVALKRFLIEISPVVVMFIAAHLYIRIDVAMLEYFKGEEVVAKYSASYLFLDQLMILSNFMMSALFPNFARASLNKGEEFQKLYRGILIVFAKYLLPIAILIAVFSSALLNLFYGAVYAEAWPSLSILMFAAVFAWINGPSGTIFISLGKQRVYMWATLLSLAVNVVGNLLLIPMIGPNGAAVSTVITEMAICGFCLGKIYKETGYLPWMRPIRTAFSRPTLNDIKD